VAAEGPIDGKSVASPVDLARVPYWQLLSSRTALGVFAAGFAAYWVIAVNITWLANYLVKQMSITPIRAGWVIGLVSLMHMVLVPGFAWISQRLSGFGVSSRVARGVVGAACVATSGASLIWMAGLQSGMLKILLIGLGFSIGNVIFTLGSTLIGEITPPTQRGAMLGITNSIHTLAGLCAPWVMGRIIDGSGNPATGFRMGYVFTGVMVITLGSLGGILIHPRADLRRFERRLPSGRTPADSTPVI
jgi:MFS family permease